MGSRSRSIALWSVALALTFASAAWQRLSGPTHPARGEVRLDGESLRYRLPRSGVTGRDLAIGVAAPAGVEGELLWRRYPTAGPWISVPLRRAAERLVADLPTQPAAGKVEYRLRFARGDAAVEIPPAPAIARFRGAVPAGVLLPHIVAMFSGMLLSNAAGLAAALAGAFAARAPRLGRWAFALMALGGLLLGPAVQKYAFDAWWTGFPFGTDLTDNKTAIALAAWAIALLVARGGRRARAAIVAAALVTLAVFAIPHSLFGSELRWEEAAASRPGS